MSNFDNMKALISSFSGQGKILTVPKIYIELTGDVNTALLLNQIVFWSDKSKRKDGYFYKTYKEWEEELTLTEYQVRRSIKKLERMGIVKTETWRANGSPTKHYKLVYEELQGSILKKLKVGNPTNLSMEGKEIKGTITEEYTEDYAEEYNNTMSSSDEHDRIPYKSIISYLNEKTGKKYRSSTKKTKSLIKARFNEGFAEDDFKKVIDNKVSDWLRDKQMAKYLRPETLFGTKFEGYLNEDKESESYGGVSF